MKSSFFSTLSASASQMLKGPTALATSGTSTSGAAAAAAPSDQGASKADGKQYLRLPIESARKLRWFDKADVQALVRSHVQEKRELNETVAALRKCLIRAGTSEADMDQELSHLLARADDIRENDRAVAEVLLVSVQDEIEQLQREVEGLRAELAQTCAAGAGSAAKSLHGQGLASPLGQAGGSGAGVDPRLVSDLQHAVQALEASMAATSAMQRHMRAAETDLAVAQATAAMLQVVQQASVPIPQSQPASAELSAWDGWDADDGWGPGPGRQSSDDGTGDAGGSETPTQQQQQQQQQRSGHASSSGAAPGPGAQPASGGAPTATAAAAAAAQLALASQLQRSETERRRLEDEVSDLGAAARAAAEEANAARQRLLSSEERCEGLSAAVEKLQADLAAARTACQAAEDVVERRTMELKKLQAAGGSNGEGAGTEVPAHVLRKYQDICLAAEERAAAMERRAALAEARCGKNEGALKEGQAAIKSLQKQLADAQQEAAAAKAAASAAESAAAAAASAAVAAAAKQPTVDAAKVAEQVEQLEQQRAEQARELASCRTSLASAQQRLSGAEVREAQLMAELRELDLVAGEREQLSAQVTALREKLSEHRSERGQLEHYRQAVRELEAGRDSLQEELVVTAQLVTQIETKLRDALQKCDQAETAAQVAEGRAHQAEASVGREVELRLTAACSNRALWPIPIREEVERMEQRLSSMQSSLVAAQAQLQADGEQLRQETAAHEAAVRRAEAAEARYADQEVELDAARRALDARVVQLENLDDQVSHLQRERSDLARQLSQTQAVFLRQSHTPGGSGGGAGGGGGGGGGDAHPKWQVQNRVGGGGLYGMSDDRQGQGGGLGAGSSLSLARRASAASSSSNSLPDASLLGGGGGPHTPRGAGHANGTPGRGKLEGVDIVYLKNVLLKFMEAAMTGKVAEREVLLPAVAALLQASPAEFQVLKRLVVNTAPPGSQVLSALGIRMS